MGATAAAAVAPIPNIEIPDTPDSDGDDPWAWTEETELQAAPGIHIREGNFQYEVWGSTADPANWVVESSTDTGDVYLAMRNEAFRESEPGGFEIGAGMDPDTVQALAVKLYEHAEWLKQSSDE
jgi:hypothetical protein